MVGSAIEVSANKGSPIKKVTEESSKCNEKNPQSDFTIDNSTLQQKMKPKLDIAKGKSLDESDTERERRYSSSYVRNEYKRRSRSSSRASAKTHKNSSRRKSSADGYVVSIEQILSWSSHLCIVCNIRGRYKLITAIIIYLS